MTRSSYGKRRPRGLKGLPRRLPEFPPLAPMTLVYTDIGSSTELHERLGIDAAHEILKRHNRVIRRQTRLHGGVEIRNTGDGFVVAFESVKTAIRCAVAIQRSIEREFPGATDPTVEVRIGISSGHVIRDGSELFGDTPIVAARVMARAEPGKILVSGDAQHLRPQVPGTRLIDRGTYHLKGLTPTYQLCEVIWKHENLSDELKPAEALMGTADATPFVGRQGELRLLEEALEQARGGRSRCVLVKGSPGIGKTRLCDEFFRRVARREFVLARSRPAADLVRPYQPLVEWSQQLFRVLPMDTVSEEVISELSPLVARAVTRTAKRTRGAQTRRPGSIENEKTRLLVAFSQLILSWSALSPIVLELDDLQWADSYTLEFLQVLHGELATRTPDSSARVLVVTTCRKEDADEEKLQPLLELLRRSDRLTTIALTGLPAQEVQSLLRAIHGKAPTDELNSLIFARTEGNPYFVREVYRDLAERFGSGLRYEDTVDPDSPLPLPESVQRVIESRLSRLSEPCRDLLRVAALIGIRFQFSTLATVSDRGVGQLIDLLDEALRGRLLHETSDAGNVVYLFDHRLIMEALLSRTSLMRRRQMHLSIAKGLEAFYADSAEEHAIELAQHYIGAGQLAPPERTTEYAILAGDSESSLFAFSEAAHFYRSALDAAERTGVLSDVETARIKVKLASASGRLGDVDEATTLIDNSLECLERFGDRDAANSARIELAAILITHTMHAEALDYLTPIVEAPAQESKQYARALAHYAIVLDGLGRSHELLPTAERLFDLARTHRDAPLRVMAQSLIRNWYVNHTADFDRARAETRSLARFAQRRQDPSEFAAQYGLLPFFDFLSGRVRQAMLKLDEALSAAKRTRSPAELVNVRALRAICACYLGEWDRVDEEWELAAPHVGRVPGTLRIGLLLWARARTDLWLGRPSKSLPKDIYSGMEMAHDPVRAASALAASESGDVATARSMLAQIAERHPREGAGLAWLITTQGLADGWINAGRPEEASKWYSCLTLYRNALYLGSVSLTRARIAATSGRGELARQEFRTSVRHCRRETLDPLLAIALYEREKARIDRNGSPTPAFQRGLDEARLLCERLGMTTYQNKILALIHETQN